jgi:hypothetical protein
MFKKTINYKEMILLHTYSLPSFSVGCVKKAATLAMAVLYIQLFATVLASATENGASTYPIGVDTRMSGVQPEKGQTYFYNYTTAYWANEIDDGHGKSLVPGFKMHLVAESPKIVHDWGVPFLGGTLHSNIAVPFMYQSMSTPTARGNETGLSNISIAVLGVTMVRKNIHWYYEGDLNLPGIYDKNHTVNIGQHNIGTGPVAAITYLPHEGRQELSSKFSYLFNVENNATKYASGNEFMWEYNAAHRVAKSLLLGINGYYIQQTTDDKKNGAVYDGGHRGRDLTVGPLIDFKLKGVSGIFKYERDTLVQNRTRGNALWFQFAFSLTHPCQ